MKKILVINNDFDTMSLIKKWLEKKGYVVKFTGNRSEARKLVRDFRPDLAIIDILQSDILVDIKGGSHQGEFPILLMTGYTSKPFSGKLLEYESIEKPFDLPLFERKIKMLLDNSVEV